MAAQKGYSIVSFLISLVLTLRVKHQDLVVGEGMNEQFLRSVPREFSTQSKYANAVCRAVQGGK